MNNDKWTKLTVEQKKEYNAKIEGLADFAARFICFVIASSFIFGAIILDTKTFLLVLMIYYDLCVIQLINSCIKNTTMKLTSDIIFCICCLFGIIYLLITLYHVSINQY